MDPLLVHINEQQNNFAFYVKSISNRLTANDAADIKNKIAAPTATRIL